MTTTNESEFCRYCGAGIGKFRRVGEGTCPKCDPPEIHPECGSGWVKLYMPLIARCKAEGVEVAQIKEKFGGLRFYINGGSDELYDAIHTAENQSYFVCEECGNPGALRKGAWLKTLCDLHAEGRPAIMSNTEKRARIWAIRWHGDQKRKYTGEPYLHHPEAVAALVKSVPHTPAMLAAAWLHDVLEDTPCTEAEMRQEFGDKVTDLVVWLTDVSKPEDGNREIRKRIDRERLAKAPVDAKTIKLADLIDNSRSIIERDPDFAKVYLQEKRLLLDEALKEGDTTLWIQADTIVRKSLA